MLVMINQVMADMDQEYYQNRKPGTKSHLVVHSTVAEILTIAKQIIQRPSKEMIVLDVGSGSGEYSLKIAKYVKKVVGVEPFESAYQQAILNSKGQANATFINCLIEDYQGTLKFDLILSLASIEHMRIQKNLLSRSLV